MKNILITGGAGFIGSTLARHLINFTDCNVLVYDKLTYAGNLSSLDSIAQNPRFTFVHADICDQHTLRSTFKAFQPSIVMHLAAETHVDRSIDGPASFIQANIVGTFSMLDTSLEYYRSLTNVSSEQFRFIHISTDEVFGSLGVDKYFNEQTPYAPNSPYSASKAGSDHLVRAWGHTYKLPVIITNCSNNYGPFHFPEKLIPLVIINAIEDRPLPIYGTGDQIRDWLYVEDHALALYLVAQKGLPGETYNIGGHNEVKNIDVVFAICDLMNEFIPREGSYRNLITHVVDRPGHDQRYAIDSSKIERELGWRPVENFQSGLKKTVRWYIDNMNWWQSIRVSKYDGKRLGNSALL